MPGPFLSTRYEWSPDSKWLAYGLHSRAQLVAQGVGERGRCTDYIRHTLEHMYALGVTDPHLAQVLETAEDIRARAASRHAR